MAARGRCRRWLDHLFVREDIGDPVGDLYLERWILLRAFGCALYLHRFERSDWSRDLHDHPRSFWTMPLVGAYWDETQGWISESMVIHAWRSQMSLEDLAKASRVRRLVRWYVPRFRDATHVHRVQLDARWPHPWTLVLMLRKQREWGFLTSKGWVRWDTYCDAAARGILEDSK